MLHPNVSCRFPFTWLLPLLDLLRNFTPLCHKPNTPDEDRPPGCVETVPVSHPAVEVSVVSVPATP